jgi:SPP1 family predicted phage head-tail adaptor
MKFRAGELDQFITITRDTETDDGMGGVDVTPVNVVSDLYARVRPMSGSEVKNFEKLNATMVNSFVIRYRNDILDTDRITWESDTYNIRAIQKAGVRELYLQIFAERGVAQ